MLDLAAATNQGQKPALDELVGFWCGVFGVPATVFTSVWNATPADRKQTFWVRDGEALCATVQIYVLPLQGGDVGCVANVATLESHRGRGLSSDLLKAAIAWMDGRGVSLSYLFTGVPPHYAKQGWVQAQESIARVSNSDGALEPAAIPDLGWMAELYDATAAKRPFAMQRDSAWWGSVVGPRLKENLVWSDDEAYLVGRREASLVLHEAAGDSSAIDRLILGATAWASGESTYYGPTNLGERCTREGGMMRGGEMPPGSWFSVLDHF